MTANYDFNRLKLEIKQLGQKLGFAQVGVAEINLKHEAAYLKKWLHAGLHGKMRYLEKHRNLREHPEQLVVNAARVICCCLDYPKSSVTNHPLAAFAQIPDYSTHMQQLLKKYVANIPAQLTQTKTRIFSGNAPILEKALAAKAGIGWYGKNTMLINNTSGSYFFLGEIFTDLPLPIDTPLTNRCGNCTQCQTQCPTQAIIAPYKLDAKKCIAYLTIEYAGVIPPALRPLIGTKIFGCDICQQVCPWNKLNNKTTTLTPLPHFHEADLAAWFLWSEQEFLAKTQSSPIRRIGYERWLRNLAIALGNAATTPTNLQALQARKNYCSPLVQEHVHWALERKLGAGSSKCLI